MELTVAEWNNLYRLADLLGWDIDRMSSGGAETYVEMMNLLRKINDRSK